MFSKGLSAIFASRGVVWGDVGGGEETNRNESVKWTSQCLVNIQKGRARCD